MTAPLAIGDELLGGNSRVDQHVENLTTKGALQRRGSFHDGTLLQLPGIYNTDWRPINRAERGAN